MASTTSSVSTSTFNGSSQYASDLQQAISRAVSLASLPVQQLQNNQNDLNNQQTALGSLSTQFQSLQSALDAINSAVGTGSYSASVDNSSLATPTISAGASVGSYSLNVTNVGSRTSTMSKAGLATVSDPKSGDIDSSTSYTLTADGKTYSVTNSSGTLDGLVQAINASGANVQATIVNVGSPSSPDYRLSVQGQAYSPNQIQLNDGTKDLLDNLGTGTYVQYQVNGEPSTPIQSDSRTVTISPGVSLNILGTGTGNVTVSQSAYGLSNALSSFATAYNSVVDELAKSRGQNAGALAGQSIIYSLQSTLQNLTNYAGSSGSISALSDLGLTFDQNGHLQFDSSVLSTTSSASLSNVLNFLGTETGGGFLQAANGLLQGVDDSTSGIIAVMNQSISNELSDLNTKITDDNDRINQLQTTLNAQMSQADSTISSLESQVNYFTSLFTQERANALAGQ